MILTTKVGEVEVVERTVFPDSIGGGITSCWKFLDWWDIYEQREPLVRAESINEAIQTLGWMERSGDVKRIEKRNVS